MVVGEVLDHVVGIQGGAVGQGDGPRDLEELPEGVHVDGQDAGHVLTGDRLPHAGRQGAGDVELGGETEIAPIDAGQEPTPIRLEVAGDDDGSGLGRDARGGNDTGEVELAVGGGEEAGLQIGAGAGTHLGVVAHEDEVLVGPLEDAGHRRGHGRGVLELGPGLVELADEVVVLGGDGSDEGMGRAGIDLGQGGIGELAQQGQPVQRRDPVGAGLVGGVEDGFGLGDGGDPDVRDLGGRPGQVLDRAELATEDGEDVDGGEQG